MKFEVYNRGRLVSSFLDRKKALAYVSEMRKGEKNSEQRFWEVRPENPFRVVDRGGRILGSFSTRREADLVRVQCERLQPGSRPHVIGPTDTEASLIKPKK
jgi:hypothetical protein